MRKTKSLWHTHWVNCVGRRKSVCLHLGEKTEDTDWGHEAGWKAQIKEGEVKRCRKDLKTCERDDNKTKITSLYLSYALALSGWLFIHMVVYLPNWAVSSFQLQHLAKSFSLPLTAKNLWLSTHQKERNGDFFFFNVQRQDLFLSFVKALTEKRIIPQGKRRRGKCFEGVEGKSRERTSSL